MDSNFEREHGLDEGAVLDGFPEADEEAQDIELKTLLGEYARFLIQDEGDDERFKALCDFLRVNRRGLADLENVSLDAASKALHRFVQEGMESAEIKRLVMSSAQPDKLFEALAARCSQASRNRLIDMVVEWRLRGRDFHRCFDGPQDFQHLLRVHRAYLFGMEDNPLSFDPNSYWIERIRWYIARCDFRRAWDEHKKAVRGFAIAIMAEGARAPTGYLHRFAASPEACEVLAIELLDAMLAMEKIVPVMAGERISDKLKFHFLRAKSARHRGRIEHRLHAAAIR